MFMHNHSPDPMITTTCHPYVLTSTSCKAKFLVAGVAQWLASIKVVLCNPGVAEKVARILLQANYCPLHLAIPENDFKVSD